MRRTQPSSLCPKPVHPAPLSQEGEQSNDTGRRPEQIYFSSDKFCTGCIPVGSSQLPPRIIAAVPSMALIVGGKLLESFLCSERIIV